MDNSLYDYKNNLSSSYQKQWDKPRVSEVDMEHDEVSGVLVNYTGPYFFMFALYILKGTRCLLIWYFSLSICHSLVPVAKTCVNT